EDTDCGHELRAVVQSEAFLRLQHDGRNAGRLHRLAARNATTVRQKRLALTHQYQRQVRKRGQVAAGADGALHRTHGEDARVKHPHQGFDEDRPHAGVALGEGVGSREEHGPDHVFRRRWTDTATVTANQVLLELADVFGWNEDAAQRAEAG